MLSLFAVQWETAHNMCAAYRESGYLFAHYLEMSAVISHILAHCEPHLPTRDERLVKNVLLRPSCEVAVGWVTHTEFSKASEKHRKSVMDSIRPRVSISIATAIESADFYRSFTY